MIANSCPTEKQSQTQARIETEREREGLTMSIVPLGKTVMADKMVLLKRTQWSLIDSLGRTENEPH